MKLPRNVDGARLAKALGVLDYVATRQTGSHLRITTRRGGEHHEVIPRHSPLKTGTLASVLKHIAAHHAISVEALLDLLGL